MPGEAPAAIHGSEEVTEGRLVGATDTDYFYFLCPRCEDPYMLRILEYYVIEEGPVAYSAEQRKDAKRDFLLAFDLKCHQCGFTDVVKLSNTGWQGGNLAERIDRKSHVLTWVDK